MMKRSSSRQNCCCCFSCWSHFWLAIMLVATSAVHVSPYSTAITTMRTPPASSQAQNMFKGTSTHGARHAEHVDGYPRTATGTKTTTIIPVADEMMSIMMNLSRAPIAGENHRPQQQFPTNSSTANGTTKRHSDVALAEQEDSMSALLMPYDAQWPRNRPFMQRRLSRQADEPIVDKCRQFEEGDPDKNEFYSPDSPNNYPKNINCTRIITAPEGQIIRLDFRNSFHIEAKEECKFDFLEVRDGMYGFSNLLGKFCGSDFPPQLTSRERYLYLHFHSDDTIEYSGFTAVYEFVSRNQEAPSTEYNCTIFRDGYEGFINHTDVPEDITEVVKTKKIPLDCIWRIEVQEKWKIQLKFLGFALAKPNDCETNFLDIFPEETVMPARLKNFCGSAGEAITSDSNIMHIRFYAEQKAINSTFSILFTAFREIAGGKCKDDEYDCEDSTCISKSLRCNHRDNCKFRWDEEGCKWSETDEDMGHLIIIVSVFGLILGGMVITFLINCIRKIMRDQKIIREHIQQSKESKLNEMGRHSKTRSRDNISAGMAPRLKHSQTPVRTQDDNRSNSYYREIAAVPSRQDTKDEHSIAPHYHDMTVQTSLCDSSSTTTHDGDKGGAANACDMGCQTRESLFASSPIRQKSINSLAGRSEVLSGVPPPPRFSTFGYDMQQEPQQRSTIAHHQLQGPHMTRENQRYQSPQTEQPQGYHHATAHPQELCHHHHQHHQHKQQPHTVNPALQQTTRAHYQVPEKQHQSKLKITPITELPTQPAGATKATPMTAGTATKSKPHQKVSESKAFVDIRNSAPDVIIMTSH